MIIKKMNKKTIFLALALFTAGLPVGASQGNATPTDKIKKNENMIGEIIGFLPGNDANRLQGLSKVYYKKIMPRQLSKQEEYQKSMNIRPDLEKKRQDLYKTIKESDYWAYVANADWSQLSALTKELLPIMENNTGKSIKRHPFKSLENTLIHSSKEDFLDIVKLSPDLENLAFRKNGRYHRFHDNEIQSLINTLKAGKKLQRIMLAYNNFTDAQLQEIYGSLNKEDLPNLEYIDLTRSSIDGSNNGGVDYLLEAIGRGVAPNLKTVISDEIDESLEQKLKERSISQRKPKPRIDFNLIR